MKVYIQFGDVRSLEKLIKASIKPDREYLLTVTETKTSRNKRKLKK